MNMRIRGQIPYKKSRDLDYSSGISDVQIPTLCVCGSGAFPRSNRVPGWHAATPQPGRKVGHEAHETHSRRSRDD